MKRTKLDEYEVFSKHEETMLTVYFFTTLIGITLIVTLLTVFPPNVEAIGTFIHSTFYGN